MLDDVYISDDDDDEESAPELSNRHVLNAASSSGSHVNSMSSDVISSKTAISQPHTLVATGSASTATSKSSKKSKQPLPPIPQHHYEQAALQIQKNKQSSPFKNTSLMDEFKMKLVWFPHYSFVLLSVGGLALAVDVVPDRRS
jgi:hypothetical protein